MEKEEIKEILCKQLELLAEYSKGDYENISRNTESMIKLATFIIDRFQV